MEKYGTEYVCSNCLFFKSHDDGGGECRKHSPTIVFGHLRLHGAKFKKEKAEGMGDAIGIDNFAVWPNTNFDDWCGEHEPMEQ